LSKWGYAAVRVCCFANHEDPNYSDGLSLWLKNLNLLKFDCIAVTFRMPSYLSGSFEALGDGLSRWGKLWRAGRKLKVRGNVGEDGDSERKEIRAGNRALNYSDVPSQRTHLTHTVLSTKRHALVGGLPAGQLHHHQPSRHSSAVCRYGQPMQ
jgi:hypothetical protein